MHSTIEISLAFILLFPAFCIIGLLYCLFPGGPRTAARLCGDVSVLILAALLSIYAMRWGFRTNVGVAGALWKQIVATLLAYGVFLSVICATLPVRALWLRGMNARLPSAGSRQR